MKTEKYIDDFIENEKKIEVTPFLYTRVAAKINAVNETPAVRKTPLLQKVAFAASIAAVAWLGTALGKTYTSAKPYEISLNINDTNLENFSLYNFDDYAN